MIHSFSKNINEFSLAWWKYGPQPSQPIRDLNPNVNSGGLYRAQLVYIADPTPVPIPTRSTVRHWPRISEPEPTPVPETPLPTFPTSTTEQFEATVPRTYPPDRIPTFQSNPTTVPKTPLPTFSTVNPRSVTSYLTNNYPQPTNSQTNNPTTVPKSSVIPSSKQGIVTSYTTNSENPDSTNDPTSIPKTPLPTFTKPESTRRSTRRSTSRPVTTSSVKPTTRPKELKQFYYSIPLKSKKYGCNWIGMGCKWKKQYNKLFPKLNPKASAQGN